MRSIPPFWLAAAAGAWLLAAGAPAGEWVEYHREGAETREFRILSRGPEERLEVLARFSCLADKKESEGCVFTLDVFRRLSLIYMPHRVVPPKAAAPAAEGPARLMQRISRYTFDCREKQYLPLSTVWYGADGNPMTQIDYDRPWTPIERLADLAERVCR